MTDFPSKLRPEANCEVAETVLFELVDALTEFLAPAWTVTKPEQSAAATKLKQAIIAAHSHGAISEARAETLIRRFGLVGV